MIWWLAILILCVEQARLVQSEKVIRITPKVEVHLQFLHRLETRGDIKVDFWKGPSRLFQTVDIGVSDYDFITLSSLLENEGIQFNVQIDDLQKLIKEVLEPVGATRGVDGFDGSGGGGNGGGSSEWHSKYHNLEEIHSKLDDVKGSYGKLTSIISLGRSHENRIMSAIKISGKSSLHKPVFFIQCGIHSREWISPATCMYIIDQMTQKYLTDDAVTKMLDKVDFVILPVLNVDGYKYTWGGTAQRLWRKNRRPHSANCFGVDLNRNWGHVWGGEGASPNECDETYRGPSAFSEVETSNVRTYLEGLHRDGKLKGFIDFHAYSQMWFIPWGYTSVDTPDHAEQMRVAKIAAEALKNKHGTRFQYGSSAALLYPAAGGSDDWTYGKLGVKYSFSVELRDKGRYGFLLPADQIVPTGEETFEGLKALVKAMSV